MEDQVEKIEFTYLGILVTIVKHSRGYAFYNEAENIMSGYYETRAEALDEAIIETEKDADFYVDLGF
jgi:hypothetical protein